MICLSQALNSHIRFWLIWSYQFSNRTDWRRFKRQHLLWRRLWRGTVWRNLKMILSQVVWKTGVLQVLIQSVFMYLRLGIKITTFRKFQKPSKKERRIDVFVTVMQWRKTEKQKTQTWRAVFVLALFWWCSACSSAAKHGTTSHKSYCLCAVIWDFWV